MGNTQKPEFKRNTFNYDLTPAIVPNPEKKVDLGYYNSMSIGIIECGRVIPSKNAFGIPLQKGPPYDIVTKSD